jgi:AbrB family looped-hinge helix DNA binding protein
MLVLKSRIGPKGEVVIPKAIRESFGMEPGGVVCFFADDDTLRLSTDNEDSIESFLSISKKLAPPNNID